MTIDNYATPSHGRLVQGHHPELRVDVVSTTNGSVINAPVSIAAGLLVRGEAELSGELDPATQADLDAAIATYSAIPAVQRARP